MGAPHWPLLISKRSVSLPWMTCRQSCHSTKEPNLFLAQSWDVDSGIPEGAEGLGWAAAHANNVRKQKCSNFDELEKRWFSTILEQTYYCFIFQVSCLYLLWANTSKKIKGNISEKCSSAYPSQQLLEPLQSPRPPNTLLLTTLNFQIKMIIMLCFDLVLYTHPEYSKKHTNLLLLQVQCLCAHF